MGKRSDISSTDRACAAVLATAGIMVGFVLYWLVQIQSVRELLQMAYG